MTTQARLRAAAAFVSLSGILLAGCGGGGSNAPNQVPSAGSPAPSTPPIIAPPNQGAYRPTLYIEQDPGDGSKFLRVEEPLVDPFAPGTPERTIADQTFGPGPGSNNVIGGPATTLIRNVDVVQMKHGLSLQNSSMVSIYDYTYTKFDGAGSIYGAGIKLGDNGLQTNGDTYIQRVVADGMQAPDPTYKVSNNDFIGIELNSDAIYIRDVTGGHFGDAGIDTKSTHVYIMNATLSGGHRMLRAWPGVEIVLVNAIINSSPGETQAWIQDGTAKISYYNTLWCQNSAAPSATDASCSRTPLIIEGENMSFSDVSARFVPLSSNPLPEINPFFRTDMDEIVVETSTDNGVSWKALALPNTGGPGSPPLGDHRYRIPLNLASANFLFRASYRLNGAMAGAYSLPINEAGTVTS